MPPIPRRLLAATAALAMSLVAACSAADQPEPGTSASPVEVAGSVVSTATSANEAQVVVPEAVAQSWQSLGAKGAGVEWVKVAGDATTTTTPVDLADSEQSGQQVADDINGDAAQADGRSALAGLDSLESPDSSPVWVFSPLLDTTGALDFNELAFDTAPKTVVKAVKKAGTLPDLEGREVVFVVTPAAGEQEKLSKLQVGYQRAVWEGMAKAAGAKRVTFFDGTGAAAGSGTISPVPVPDPNDKIASAGSGKSRTCTLPSPALFVADQPTLIDKKATLKALKECVGELDSSTKITVEGHTAGVAGADNDFAKDLSTQRATEVAALLRELDVPARNISEVVGYGSSKPLVKPASDPENRAVVVTFTSAA